MLPPANPPFVADFFISASDYSFLNFQNSGSALITQKGESLFPTKLSEQSVLSLGAETARSGLSVGKGA